MLLNPMTAASRIQDEDDQQPYRLHQPPQLFEPPLFRLNPAAFPIEFVMQVHEESAAAAAASAASSGGANEVEGNRRGRVRRTHHRHHQLQFRQHHANVMEIGEDAADSGCSATACSDQAEEMLPMQLHRIVADDGANKSAAPPPPRPKRLLQSNSISSDEMDFPANPAGIGFQSGGGGGWTLEPFNEEATGDERSSLSPSPFRQTSRGMSSGSWEGDAAQFGNQVSKS